MGVRAVAGGKACAVFFSSRRRHTRLVSDWSSDVCSSDLHRVPRMLIDPAIPLDLSRIETDLSGHLLGQSDAVRTIVRMIGLIKSGLTNVRRPFGVFLFVGPTGVGKTHLAQLLAETLFGDRDRVLRINMADYQSERSSYALFGESWEDRISLRRGVLTQRVAGQPFAVLLLDEFEKASPKLHDQFLHLFDAGCFINGAGESVSRRSIIL